METFLGVLGDVTVLSTLLSYLGADGERAVALASPPLWRLLGCYRTVTFVSVPCLSSTPPSFSGAHGVPRLVFTGRSDPPAVAVPPLAPAYCPLRRRWLCYLKHTAGTGWGVHAGRSIPAGTPLLVYTGEVISTGETVSRQAREYDPHGRNYVLTVREHGAAAGRVLRTNVDATHFGSVARFVNHSCAPNLNVTMVRAGGAGQLVGVAVLVARVAVAPGEPLTFSYAGDDRAGGGGGGGGGGGDEGGGGSAKRRRVPCKCGAAACVGWLPFSSQ